MRGIWQKLFGSNIVLYVNSVDELFDRRSDDLVHQDAYLGYLDDYGILSSPTDGEYVPESEIRENMQTALNSGFSDGQIFNLLSTLEIQAQNQTAAGIASPVIQEILDAQSEIVLRNYYENIDTL